MGRPRSVRTHSCQRHLLAIVVGNICLALVASAPAAETLDSSARAPGTAGPSSAGRQAVVDVAIQPDGVLRGRILDASSGISSEACIGLPITFLRGDQVIGRTFSDTQGQFAVARLTRGVYQVVVERPNLTGSIFCRVWPADVAPPRSLSELTIVTQPNIVRGQSALWVMWPPSPAAVMVATGAIAAPIIYNNVHKDNRVPASP